MTRPSGARAGERPWRGEGICKHWGSAPAGRAQAVRPLPCGAQLRTDPAVGNIQGIQRYGRPLKTDPDEGEGFSYHVYPVAENPSAVVVAGGVGGGQAPPGLTFTQAVG